MGEGRHPGLVEIVEVVGAELALHVLRRLGEHLLERHDLDLDLDAGRLGELVLDLVERRSSAAWPPRCSGSWCRHERACRLRSAIWSSSVSGALAASVPKSSRPRNGRGRLPSMPAAKAEKPTPASAILRRKSRLQIRRRLKARAVSTMKVCLIIVLEAHGIPPWLRSIGDHAGSFLQRAEGQAAHQMPLHQQDEDEARQDGRTCPSAGDEAPFRSRRGDEGRDLDRHGADEVVRNSDSRNSVQEKMKQSTAVAAMPPRTIGSTTRRKVWQRVAPSIIAASSTSAARRRRRTSSAARRAAG